jgi:hypothetical protein
MTDMEFTGIPLHPLVVHAAVIFGPLGALTALAYAGLPRWRDRLRWPMLGLVLLGSGAIFAAYFTGTSFMNSRPDLQALASVQLHRSRGLKLTWVTVGFAPIGVVAAWLHGREGMVRLVLNVLLGAGALAVLVLAALTGDAGARAVWGR